MSTFQSLICFKSQLLLVDILHTGTILRATHSSNNPEMGTPVYSHVIAEENEVQTSFLKKTCPRLHSQLEVEQRFNPKNLVSQSSPNL